MKTPVLFMVFNRPVTTHRVFEAIRAARPAQLFVAADGPRPNRPGEADLCRQTRQIATDVDWPCEVRTLFRDSNLGCAKAVSSAIDWFFDQVEEGIILEDDCLPDKSFFPFCSELLNRYRGDTRICAVCGINFQRNPPRDNLSYYFSRFNHCWGWASWRRAWKFFDYSMSTWPEVRRLGWLTDILENCRAAKHWQSIFDKVYTGQINSWAYRWTYSCWIQNMLAILPSCNLVENIGFGSEATHTIKSGITPKCFKIRFPLQHPSYLLRDAQADLFTLREHYGVRSFQNRITRKLLKVLSKK